MKKILLIDDKKDNLIWFNTIMKRLKPDCKTFLVRSGESGLKTAHEEKPDAVILDVEMPGMDGFEVCRRLKKSKSTRHIPVMMLTAVYNDSESKIKGYKAGADMFLTKPLEIHELIPQLNLLLRVKSAEDKLRDAQNNLGKGHKIKLHDISITQTSFAVDEKEQKSEEMLKLSENKYKSLLDTVEIGIIFQNSETEILSANPAAEKILGIPIEKLRGMTCKQIGWDAIHEDGTKFPVETFPAAEAIRTGKKVRNIVMGLKNKSDNEIRWLNIHSVPQFLHGRKKPYQVYTIFEDITQIKKTTDALIKSRNKYQELFEKSQDAILILQNNKFIDCNPSTLEMFNYKSKDEIFSKHPSDISPEKQPDGRGSFEKAEEMIKIAREKGGNRFEWDHKRASGEVFPAEVILTPVITEEGSKIIHSVVRDITQRKKADKLYAVLFAISQAAHGSKSLNELLDVVHGQLAELLDTTNFYVAIYNEEDDTYSFPYFKDQYDDVDAVSPFEMKNSLTDYVRRTGKPLLADAETSKMLYEKGEVGLVGVDSPIWIGAPLINGDKVLGVVAIQDYTDPDRYSQSDLDVLNFVAENIVAAIEKKIADEKLERSESELKKKNADKDKLFSLVAHDLRAPFNALLGSSEFLVSDVEDLENYEIKEFAGLINQSAKGLLKLLDNLLLWARQQIGGIESKPDIFDLNDAVNEIMKVYSANAQQKNINLNSRIEKDQFVFCDQDMIRTVLRNLVSNSIKFTKSGGEVSIFSRKDGNNILVTVADEGVGMSKEKCNSLFDIGKIDSTLGTEKEKGAGLGLLLCKDFVELNNGNIFVESEIGKGTKFKFTIPAKPKE